MFAHDLCRRQIEYFSLTLAAVVAPTPRRAIPQIFDLNSSILKSGLSGLGYHTSRMIIAYKY